MIQQKIGFNQWIWTSIGMAMSMVLLACNATQWIMPKKQPDPDLSPTVTEGKVAQTTVKETHPAKTQTIQAVKSTTQKITPKKESTPLPTAMPDYAVSSFEGNYHGVKYSMIYPGDFSHTSSNGRELFCLKTDKSLRVTVHPSNGNWNDAKALADEVMSKVKENTSNMVINEEQNTNTVSDGFPAYWVRSTYTYQGKESESLSLFVVIQHIGFEIVADGSPLKVEAYRKILDGIMNSFTLEYN